MDIKKLQKRLKTEINYWTKRRNENEDGIDAQYYNTIARESLQRDNKLCTRHINNIKKAIDILNGS